VGNAPGWASLRGARRGSGGAVDPASWTELLPKTRLQPDTRHVVRIPDAGEVDTVRLDVFPDGGMARVRLHGALSDQGRAELGLRWFNSLPAAQAGQVLERDCGLAGGAADGVVAGRPVVDPSALPGAVRTLLTGGARWASPSTASPWTTRGPVSMRSTP
jgi:allantoicase